MAQTTIEKSKRRLRGQPALDEMTCEDFLYCEDCRCFVDLWKYDTVEDTGHADCRWRYVTAQELAESIADCRQAGCFEEERW